ncbi:MAG: PHP domain-containing protein [Desulfovibrionaceae bacterium]|nr:PHP domain-containing protein [Desulfovibrionaceae bacterium]
MAEQDNRPLAGFIDLHTHTTASDGTATPAEVVETAHGLGLDAIAITDHDCMDGVAEAVQTGLRLGQTVIPGCELAAHTPYGEMHIVGLWAEPGHKTLNNLLKEQQAMRELRFQEILAGLHRVGINLNKDEVAAETGGGNSVGRPHIARALLRKGYAHSVQDAFKRYLVPGKAGYAPRRLLSPDEVLTALKEAGVTTVFAHPMSLPAPEGWVRKEAERLHMLGLLDGIEAYHPEHDKAKVQYVEQLAADLGLLLSGGSDYHGTVKPKIRLGFGEGRLRVPVELLAKMKSYRENIGLPV